MYVLVRPLVSPAFSAIAVLWTCMGDLSRTLGSVSDLGIPHYCHACHLHHRATEGVIASTLDGPAWANRCDVCGRVFLKNAVGMTAWREEAIRRRPEIQRHSIVHLPVSRYRREDCGAFSSRRRGGAKRAAEKPANSVLPPASVFPPTQRAHRPQPPMTPPPSTPPQFPSEAVFPRVSSGRVRGRGAPTMACVRELPDMVCGRTVPGCGARCSWKRGAGQCRFLLDRGPCQESPPPSQGTAGAAGSFPLEIPKERGVLSAEREKN